MIQRSLSLLYVMIRQVAKYLGVDLNLIVRCEEWFTVLFVIVKGFRPTFVSKKILKQSPQFLPGDLVISNAGCCYEVVRTTDNGVSCYPLDLTLYARGRGFEQFVFPASQLTVITSSYPATLQLPQRELITAQKISSQKAGVQVVKAGVGVNN